MRQGFKLRQQACGVLSSSIELAQLLTVLLLVSASVLLVIPDSFGSQKVKPLMSGHVPAWPAEPRLAGDSMPFFTLIRFKGVM
jgi:hypothetical protein